MLLIIFILSYICIAFFIAKIYDSEPLQYSFRFILISICYLYLFVNVLKLQAEKEYLLATEFILISFIYFFVLTVSMRIGKNELYFHSWNKYLEVIDSTIDRLTKNSFLLNIFIGIYAIGAIFLQKFMSYEASVTYRMETSGITQYFRSIISYIFITPLTPLILIAGIRLKKYLHVIVFIIFAIISALSGSRVFIITLGFGIYYVLYRIRHKIIRPISVLLFILIGMLTIIVAGHARSGKTAQENISNFTKIITSMNPVYFNILGIGEFYYPSLSIVEVLTKKEMSMNLLLPFEDLSTIVPTNIWPGRPTSPAEQRMIILYPDEAKKGRGYGFSNVAYGYWWMGYLGVIIYGIIGGILFKAIDGIIKRYKNFGTFFFITIITELFNFARGTSIIGFIKNSLFLKYIPMFLGLFLYSQLLRFTKNEKNIVSR